MASKDISVSIVIPLYNAEKYIIPGLEAILAQDYGGDLDVIVVNDGSTDRSRELIAPFEASGRIRVIDQPNQGAVAATNTGIRAARHSIVCSVDSDAVLHRDWVRKIVEEFLDPQVGAVQGYIASPAGMPFIARMAGYDLECRYDRLDSKYVTQVSTTNTAYRRSALDAAGLFDGQFSYGYDNDMSYRIQKAGYRLVFRKDAFCDHYWKADLRSYVKQQYRSAFGRLQLINKHRDRLTGDSVSGLRMILQVPLTLLTALFLLLGLVTLPWGHSAGFFRAAAVLFAVMVADRLVFASGVVKKQKDRSAWFMPAVHLLRNAVWCWAFISWNVRGAFGKL